MTPEQVRERLADVWRKKKLVLCILAGLSVGMGVTQGLERDWPIALFCIGIASVLWREGTLP